METKKYHTDTIWEWVGIKLAGGPEPVETITANKKTIVSYDYDEVKDFLPLAREHMPSTEALALYNHYKHNIAFKKIDEKKEINNG